MNASNPAPRWIPSPQPSTGASRFNSPAGIYSKFYNADSARSLFPQSGTYTVDITLFGKSFDDWGKPTGETEKYPTASARFAFQFSGTDGQTLVANHTKARESVEAAKNRKEMLHAMPDWWFKGATPPEPKLAPAVIKYGVGLRFHVNGSTSLSRYESY